MNCTETPTVIVPNGCSGGVGWFYKNILRRTVPILYCCDEHDVAYGEGITAKDKVIADKRFYACINSSKRPIKAKLFYLAVRLFGFYSYYFKG